MSFREIFGHCDFDELYAGAVAEAPPNSVFVEVGTFLGRSVASLAEQAIKANKGLQIYAVDTWVTEPGWGGTEWPRIESQGGAFASYCHDMFLHAREALDFVRVLRLSSVDASSLFVTWKRVGAGFNVEAFPGRLGAPYFVFIDANHTYEEVKKDLAHWAPAVAKGGILAGHDHTPEYQGVIDAVRERFGDGGYEVRGTSWWKRM